MCVSPISIKNPNYGSKVPSIVATKDTVSAYIAVPCGVCYECQCSRQNGFVARASVMALDHHVFFATLTYNDDSLPCLGLSTGESIPYADIRDIRLAIKRIRKNNLFSREFSYLAASERGSKRGRPHFHVLFFVRKEKNDTIDDILTLELRMRSVLLSEWRRFVGSRRSPKWKNLCTFKRVLTSSGYKSNYDLHYVDPASSKKGSSDVFYYVTKYILKGSDKDERVRVALYHSLDSDEYNKAWQIVKSKVLVSKHFGLKTQTEFDFLRTCVCRSLSNPEGIKIYDPESCKEYFIPRYYMQHSFSGVPVVSFEDYVFNIEIQGGPERFFKKRQRSFYEKLKSVEDGNRIRSAISCRDISVYF